MGWVGDSNEKQETFQQGQVKMSKGFFFTQIIEFSWKIKLIIITKYALWLKNVLETIKTDKRFDYQAAAWGKACKFMKSKKYGANELTHEASLNESNESSVYAMALNFSLRSMLWPKGYPRSAVTFVDHICVFKPNLADVVDPHVIRNIGYLFCGFLHF